MQDLSHHRAHPLFSNGRAKSDFSKTRQALHVSPRKWDPKRFGSSSALSIVNAGALVSSSRIHKIYLGKLFSNIENPRRKRNRRLAMLGNALQPSPPTAAHARGERPSYATSCYSLTHGLIGDQGKSALGTESVKSVDKCSGCASSEKSEKFRGQDPDCLALPG